MELLGAVERLEHLGVVDRAVADASLAMLPDLPLDQLAEHEGQRTVGRERPELRPDLLGDPDASHVIARRGRRCLRLRACCSPASSSHQRLYTRRHCYCSASVCA